MATKPVRALRSAIVVGYSGKNPVSIAQSGDPPAITTTNTTATNQFTQSSTRNTVRFGDTPAGAPRPGELLLLIEYREPVASATTAKRVTLSDPTANIYWRVNQLTDTVTDSDNSNTWLAATQDTVYPRGSLPGTGTGLSFNETDGVIQITQPGLYAIDISGGDQNGGFSSHQVWLQDSTTGSKLYGVDKPAGSTPANVALEAKNNLGFIYVENKKDVAIYWKGTAVASPSVSGWGIIIKVHRLSSFVV